MGSPVHARSSILEEIVQIKVAWKQRDRMKPGLDYNMDWVDIHQLLAASWPSLTKRFHSFLKHQPTEEQTCARVVPPGLGGRILLLRIPHTLVIGHGGIMATDQKASSLWTSFHGTRMWYAGRWGERRQQLYTAVNPGDYNNNWHDKRHQWTQWMHDCYEATNCFLVGYKTYSTGTSTVNLSMSP